MASALSKSYAATSLGIGGNTGDATNIQAFLRDQLAVQAKERERKTKGQRDASAILPGSAAFTLLGGMTYGAG